MNASVKDRKSASVSRLIKGDIVIEGDDYFEVTGLPESHAQGIVTVPLRKVDGTNRTRSRRYDYHSDVRFKLVK